MGLFRRASRLSRGNVKMQERLDGNNRHDPGARHRRFSDLNDRFGDGLDLGLVREDFDLGMHADALAASGQGGSGGIAR